MKRRFFGTDGVRGPYGGPVMNEAFVSRLGYAAARRALTARPDAPRRAVIGRDTRASGPALEAALAGGLSAAGLAVETTGVLPTPGIALAVSRGDCALGAAVTASHNPAGDNGIKFFGSDGLKLSDADEAAIESMLADPPAGAAAALAECRGAREAYLERALAVLAGVSISGWKIAVDGAHGAGAATTPEALRRLGAEVVAIGVHPDGRNINEGVGSQHPEALARLVLESGARVGMAHDGDADRLVLVDEQGGVLDGDEILAVLGLDLLRRGRLAEKTLVATVQSNLGLDAALAAEGGRVLRTPVGDRYVAEALRAGRYSLGGESSGHIICPEVSGSGDGLAAALLVLRVLSATGRPLSQLRAQMRKYPQLTDTLPVREKPPVEGLPTLGPAMARAEAELGAAGRVLVRYSGTEPKLRLLVEADSDSRARAILEALRAAARTDLG